MYHPSSQTKEVAKRFFVYGLMTLAVIGLVVFLIMTMLGYKFNQADGSLVQSGLVQFVSQPSGADVFVDGKDIGSNTTTKATLNPGDHSIAMKRTGYRDWTKQVSITSGTITWLNYARLIPKSIQTTPVYELDELASGLASPGGKWYALKPSAGTPEIIIADLQRDTPTTETLAIPEDVYTHPEEGQAQVFKLSKWDYSGRHVLVEHTYGESNREWLVFDRDNPARSKNITTLLGINPEQVEFADNSGQRFYILEAGNVRRINLDDATLSRPLITHVDQFRIVSVGDKLLTYTTAPDENGKRSAGYYRDSGDNKPHVLKEYDLAADAPLMVDIGEYYDDTYIAFASGNKVDIYMGELPTGSKVTPMKLVDTLELDGNVDKLEIKGSGRFIYTLAGSRYVTYDLEKNDQHSTQLMAADQPLQIKWLDEYMLWSDLDGQLQFYEFDGANHQQITPVAGGYDVTLARDGRFVYSIGKDSSGKFTLQRTQLRL